MKVLIFVSIMLIYSVSFAQKNYYGYDEDAQIERELDSMFTDRIPDKPIRGDTQLDRMLEQQMRQMETIRTLQIYDEVYREESHRLRR